MPSAARDTTAAAQSASDDEEQQGLLAGAGAQSGGAAGEAGDGEEAEVNPLELIARVAPQNGTPEKKRPPLPPATMSSEFFELGKLAWPLSLTFGLQQASQQVNIMFVGQLGPTELGAVVLATMWANISGTSIAMGGMTALDSLASQVAVGETVILMTPPFYSY